MLFEKSYYRLVLPIGATFGPFHEYCTVVQDCAGGNLLEGLPQFSERKPVVLYTFCGFGPFVDVNMLPWTPARAGCGEP